MTAADKESIPPLFQAIGTMPGRLAVNESGRYQLDTPDGSSFPVFIKGWLYKRIRETPDWLGQELAWSVYPKTDQLGRLTYFQLIRVGAQPTRQADEFHISGRVVPAPGEGLIGVRIQPNRPRNQPSKPGKTALPGRLFSPFYINLHGYLPGDPKGEVWRFVCQRQGGHLEMVDGVKVKARRAQKKQKKTKGAGAVASTS